MKISDSRWVNLFIRPGTENFVVCDIDYEGPLNFYYWAKLAGTYRIKTNLFDPITSQNYFECSPDFLKHNLLKPKLGPGSVEDVLRSINTSVNFIQSTWERKTT